jgi:hypothetical protein
VTGQEEGKKGAIPDSAGNPGLFALKAHQHWAMKREKQERFSFRAPEFAGSGNHDACHFSPP